MMCHITETQCRTAERTNLCDLITPGCYYAAYPADTTAGPEIAVCNDRLPTFNLNRVVNLVYLAGHDSTRTMHGT